MGIHWSWSDDNWRESGKRYDQEFGGGWLGGGRGGGVGKELYQEILIIYRILSHLKCQIIFENTQKTKFKKIFNWSS